MVIGGGKGSGFNPDEPRDEHGRWTGGGALPWQDNKLKDRSALGRAAVLAGYAYVHLPDRLRRRTGWPDETASARLARLIGSWNDAGDIDDDAFRERYLGRRVSVTATRHLRAAASMAANASTSGEMAEAGKHLAAAITDIGIEGWPQVQHFANDAAAVEDGEGRNSLLVPVRAPGTLGWPLIDLETRFGPAWAARAGAAVLDALDSWNEREQVEEVLKKFDLDPNSGRDVLAARAYVWAKTKVPINFDVPWSGPELDTVAETLMLNELVYPGTLGMATEEENPDAIAEVKRVIEEAIELGKKRSELEESEKEDDEAKICPDPENKAENMSIDAFAYQQQITGLGKNKHVVFNGIDFDGCRDTNGWLQEAKAKYEQFVDSTTGNWKFFFSIQREERMASDACEGNTPK